MAKKKAAKKVAKKKTAKRVYFFGNGKAEANAKMKELLGGKGANLAEMTSLGVPVPPGFTISTQTCHDYNALGKKWPKGLKEEVAKNVAKLERAMKAKFGDPKKPLLVSVRSGAAVSMPGMMDTVLNLGLNDDVVAGIIEKTGNARFAYDIYRRFIDMFGDVVMGCHHEHFEAAIHKAKVKAGVENDNELSADQLKAVVEDYKKIYKKDVGEMFPQDPMDQLAHSINAVFGSWDAPRAIRYRQMENITGLLGTAVNVQAMVFGNMGDDCGTGVCFTRNPSTGKKEFYGEYLINAQGEDVVAGIRTPQDLKHLKKDMPKAYKELTGLMTKLEKHYKDMQDMEFTIQEKVTPEQMDRLLHPHFDPKAARNVIATGLPASPGAAVGQVVFDADVAEQWAKAGKTVILVRIETSPEDIGGMDAAIGILTQRGGMTSHAAVVARGMGKCCVAGAGDVVINYKKKCFTVGRTTVKQGDFISLEGTEGQVILGKVSTVEPKLSGSFGQFLKMCDKIRTLGIRTNADTPGDSKRARDFGAEGIGLTRTEHMFFEGERIWPVREMILAADDYAALLTGLADTEDKKEAAALKKQYGPAKKQFEGALKKLLPYQRKDFVGIFKAMAGLPGHRSPVGSPAA
jgi:pyruvate,orthophosphate dikinase